MLTPSSHNRRHWGYHPDSGGFGARPLLAVSSVNWDAKRNPKLAIANSTNANADQVQLHTSRSKSYQGQSKISSSFPTLCKIYLFKHINPLYVAIVINKVKVTHQGEGHINRVPTQPGKPGKMRVHLENLEISWNFEKFNKYHGKMT